MIAAIKRTVAKISRILLWPLTALAATIARVNRRVIRWAIRRRCGPAYLAAIFWAPTLTVSGIVWAMSSIHQKPEDIWPVIGAVLLGVKKAMALILYVAQQAEGTVKALRLYRRLFVTNV